MNTFPFIRVRAAALACFAFLACAVPTLFGADWISYEPKPGPGIGKHIVFLAGDEEYRSEEGLPMLAKILSQRHGFKTTVLFSVGADGTIDPNNGGSLSHPEALDSADAIVMLLRFRHWPDDASKRFDAAVKRGVPIIALRTSTHAFNGYANGSPWEDWNYGRKGGFGRQVLGETWVNHWGSHKSEATRGVIEPSAKSNPIFNGVADIFGLTDVYEAYPTPDCKILLRGQVLKGMNHDDAPADYKKKRANDKMEQGINDPMMAIAWTRENKNENGKNNRVFTTTMGAATDLVTEDLRRLIVNAVYWGMAMPVPAKADVDIVDGYKPTPYGFDGFRKGVKPVDLALGKPIGGASMAPAKVE
jgi:hypothetical protein